MPGRSFTIQYEGRSPRLPRPIADAFESAGYSVSLPKRASPKERAPFFTVELTAANRNRRASGARPDGAARPMAAMSLRALRESAGRTQHDIARKVSMTQPQLSRVEARRDHLTSTLRKYVGALGGRIEVVAVVKGRRIVLHNV